MRRFGIPATVRCQTATPVHPLFIAQGSSAAASYLRSLSRLILIFISFLLLPIPGSSCRQLRKQKADPVPIDLTQPLKRRISRGESHSYRISSSPGQYLRLRVDQKQTDITISLRKLDSDESRVIRGIENEPSIFSLIADASDSFELNIRSAENGNVSGLYEIIVEERRPATEFDRKYIVAETAFLEGERLKYNNTVQSSRDSISKYYEAQSQWHSLNRKREEAIALKNKGLLQLRLGEPHPALECYQVALSLIEASDDPGLYSEILCNTSEAYIHIGESSKALKSGIQALQLSNEVGDLRRKAISLNSLADVHYGFGDRWKSLELNRQALSIWEGLIDRRGRAETFSYLGHLQRDLGESQKAAEYYDQALAIYSAVNDQRGRARILTSNAGLEVFRGNNQKALDLYSEALPILQTAGDRLWEASVILNTGFVYHRLGDNDKALFYFKQAHQIWHDINNPANEAGALSSIGWIYYLKGEYQIALEHFKQVLRVTQSIDDKKFQSNALRKIGAVYSSLGDKNTALTHYKRALSLHLAAGERQGAASALTEIGKLYHNMGKNREALNYYESALKIDRLRGDRLTESQTLFNIARIERDLGHPSNSRSHIEAASSIVESLRAEVASPSLRAIYFSSIQQYFEFHIDLLMRQNNITQAKALVAEALQVNESARARSLLELLTESSTNIRQGANPKLIERERDLRKQMEDQVNRKMALIDAKAPESELANISKEVSSLGDECERIESQIRSQSPLYASLTKPTPASLKDIQELLDDNTVLLEYALGNQRSYLWAVTRAGLKGYELPGRPKIEKIAAEAYKLLSKSQFYKETTKEDVENHYWQQASELSKLILAPVADQLGNKRLLVVPDGALQYIPFQALPEPRTATSSKKLKHANTKREDTEPKPLIIDHEIINLPSASTLAVLRRETAQRNPAPKTIAVFANPVFQEDDLRVLRATGKLKDASNVQIASNRTPSDTRSFSTDHRSSRLRDGIGYPPLYSTQDEANAIIAVTSPQQRQVWMDFDANRANALGPELNQYRIIHFATHGDLDNDNPELSAIVLSFYDKKGQRQEGFLRLHDIYNLKLSADLVVLSACQTALGKEIKGEGLIGLTRGFMYAGAARVMASLWKVEDESTAELMKHFYKFLLKDKLTPAASLRQAQIELWKNPNFSAPYHWAGFVLQGEWK